MPVEDVFKPKTIKAIDPRGAAEKDGEGAEYWTKKAAGAKARLDYQEYEQAMRMLGQTPEAPFTIKGAVDLGTIDVQQQQRDAQAQADKVRTDKDAELKTEREHSAGLQDELSKERTDGMRRDFDSRLAEVNKTIERLATAPKKDDRPIHEQFKDQLTALRDMAQDLGLEKTSSGRDPMVDIELAKMSYEQAREDREFKWKMRQDEKTFQLQLQTAADDREYKRAQIKSQAKRDEMIASIPEQIGDAAGRAIVDSTKRGAAQQRPIGQSPAAPQAPAIQLGEGESGTIGCTEPGCGSMIEVAATTTLAQCLGCNARYPVIRVPRGEPRPTEEDE